MRTEPENGDLAIAARDLGKRYRIYRRPFDRLGDLLWPRGAGSFAEFWALRGVSFDVKRGQMLGVIGRNGAGKSTLLRILAGVLKPSTGEAQLRGPHAALLSLGCGFNGAYTGRENVMLTGQIMGLSRSATFERLDAIREFADLGDFFDRPAALYSTGMVTRLAFAIGAHLPADLLILDEVLSVGDLAFQRKCFERIREIRARGVTIVLATHDTNALRLMCDAALLLEGGQVRAAGNPAPVVDEYVALMLGSLDGTSRLVPPADHRDLVGAPVVPCEAVEQSFTPEFLARVPSAQRMILGEANAVTGDRRVELEAVILVGATGEPVAAITIGGVCTVRSLLCFREPVPDFALGILLRDRFGQDIFGQNARSGDLGLRGPFQSGERVAVDFRFRCDLRQDTYFVTVGIGDGAMSIAHYFATDLLELRVEPAGGLVFGIANLPYEFSARMMQQRTKQAHSAERAEGVARVEA